MGSLHAGMYFFGQLSSDLHRVAHLGQSPILGLLGGHIRENPHQVQGLVLDVLPQLRLHRRPVGLEADTRHGGMEPAVPIHVIHPRFSLPLVKMGRSITPWR